MPSTLALEGLLERLQNAAKIIATKKLLPNQSFFEEKERSIENWIVIELGLALAKALGADAVNFEVRYSKQNRMHCDMVLRDEERRLWVEVAHVWNWSQSKWKGKCEGDVLRIQNILKEHPSDRGCLLLFLPSPEGGVNETVRRWTAQHPAKNLIHLIEVGCQ